MLFPWVPTQNLLGKIYFYIILDINSYHILKRDLHKACNFSNMFYFIGTINDHLELDKNFQNIYNSELQL